MKAKSIPFFLLSLALVASCNPEQNNSLSPAAFAERIDEKPGVVLDVRTPAEFAEGHLANSRNIDWNDEGFEEAVQQIQAQGAGQAIPVYIYCLSGKRSNAAAKKMLSLGFKEVYLLEGGIREWEAANLPVVKD